jgi:hypothetical protein
VSTVTGTVDTCQTAAIFVVGVPIKKIKKKNSLEVLGEKQTSGSLVILQECDGYKCFVSINIL